MKFTLTFADILNVFKMAGVACAIGAALYLLFADHLEARIAHNVLQEIDLKAALFQLEKEHTKYINGDKSIIQKGNLDIVLRNKQQILARNAGLFSQVEWASSYYHCHFVLKEKDC